MGQSPSRDIAILLSVFVTTNNKEDFKRVLPNIEE